MATLRFSNGWADFNPVSAALGALSNGPGTIVALVRKTTAGTVGDHAGLVDATTATTWYHTLATAGSGNSADDDGIVFVQGTAVLPAGSTADDFCIHAVTWPGGAGGAAERFHISSKMGAAESWTHENSVNNNGADHAGPGTSGHFMLGNTGDGAFVGDIALVAVWAGVQLTDLEIEDLWVSKQTSDWYNHAAGTPDLLIECTSTSPTDIGGNPSTFSALGGTTTPTLTGLDPTGWTFDGQGSSSQNISISPATETDTAQALVVTGGAQKVQPTADSVDGAWLNESGSNTNLFASVDEATASDSDYITSEAAPSSSKVRLKLDPGLLDPGGSSSGTDHILHWRPFKDQAAGAQINMTIQLFQGGGDVLGAGTSIASFNRLDVSNTPTTFDETLSAGQADSITDYGDLYVEITANQV